MQIRKSIKTLFPNRDCFSLVRPMSDEKQLARLETIPPDQMRPEFVEVASFAIPVDNSTSIATPAFPRPDGFMSQPWLPMMTVQLPLLPQYPPQGSWPGKEGDSLGSVMPR